MTVVVTESSLSIFDRLIRHHEQRKIEHKVRSLFRAQPPFRPSELDPSRSRSGTTGQVGLKIEG